MGAWSGRGYRERMAHGAVVIVPARLASTRFAEKVLADRTGRPLVQHVVDAVRQSAVAERVVVATDHARVAEALRPFGTQVVMTRVDHPNGTSRLAEAAAALGLGEDQVIVNAQGDEPEMAGEVITAAVRALLETPGAVVGTAAAPLGAKDIPPADSPVPGARHGFAERFGPAATTSYRQMPDTAEMPKAAPKDPKLVNAWKTKAGRELTDAELLAMPESEYMNDKQLDFFRARLEQQKADLLSSAGETTEHLREDTSIVPDPVDRATIEEEHALELRTRDRERKLLKKIAQALARLDNGDYGYCDETGEPIGLQRLMARPTATLSLEAQQRREMKQRMFGD